MNQATLYRDDAKDTWYVMFDGKVLAHRQGGDGARDYVIAKIRNGWSAKAKKLGITDVSNAPDLLAPSPYVFKNPAPKVKPNNELSVEERFELLDECVDIVLNSLEKQQATGVRSLIITGAGSVGKTFHTKERIKIRNLKSTAEAALEKAKRQEVPEEDKWLVEVVENRMQELKVHAENYYAQLAEEKEDESLELELEYGPVDYLGLQNSKDKKQRRCGGTYLHANRSYQFNLALMKENPDEYVKQIIPHEIAHQIQHVLFPDAKNAHGKEWKRIMRECFQIPDDTYHQMDTASLQVLPELEGDYHYVKGYSSAKGLYRTLYQNRSKLIVFDDCDAAWKNEVSANLLKAALDSDSERWVSWNVEQGANDDVPNNFLFEGRVIFISEEFPQALITRALRCDLELNIEERFERMRQILPSEKFAGDVDMKIKQEAFNFLYENRERATEISSRALLNVIQVANSGSKLWKRIALSNMA